MDDMPLFIVRRDYSGGQNTRVYSNTIAENQAALLTNVDIGVPAKRKKRRGSVLIGDDKSNDTVVALHNYSRQGYADELIMVDGNSLRASEAEGNWADVKTDFTASLTDYGIVSIKESGLVPDDVIIVQNGTDNPVRLHKASGGSWAEQDLGSTSGTGSDSPPKSTVMCWYGNRLWVLKNDLLYYSTAYDEDYSSAFDTGVYYRLPVGEERGLVATRDIGIITMGADAIWGLAPSVTPAATDRPQPLVTEHGVVSKNGWVSAGDDVYYFAKDGFRALKRTVQDKLQAGVSYPLSYMLKDSFENINWEYIDQLSMEYFDNKIFISVPTGETTYDTWVYYPALDGFSIISGWSPRCWAKFKVNNEERLYYGKHGDGVVYRAWHGYTDEGTTTTDGTAISYRERGRAEDLGLPMMKKWGGEVEVRAVASGNHDITVKAQFDGAGFNTLGTLNLSGNLITFPLSFPVSFADANIVQEKYHLDEYGYWREAQVEITHADTNSDDDITILQHSITTFKEEYESE